MRPPEVVCTHVFCGGEEERRELLSQRILELLRSGESRDGVPDGEEQP